MTDLTKPLAEVPVGAHVVHEGEVWKVAAIDMTIAVLQNAREPHRVHVEYLTARVLHLDGDAPRSLAECVGRDVWDPVEGGVMAWDESHQLWRWDTGHMGSKVPQPDAMPVWPIVPPQPEADQPQRWLPFTASDRHLHHQVDAPTADHPQRWEAYLNGTIWCVADVVNDQEFAEMGTEFDARALADHLNATGWQPPAPEPERPLIDHIIGNERWGELAEHGYRVVDVRELGDAIDWLRDTFGHHDPGSHAGRIILDALGVDR